MKLELTKIADNKYELRFDIQEVAYKMGITKEKLAEFMADELMKIFGIVLK